jgi:hypothetical protein
MIYLRVTGSNGRYYVQIGSKLEVNLQSGLLEADEVRWSSWVDLITPLTLKRHEVEAWVKRGFPNATVLWHGQPPRQPAQKRRPPVPLPPCLGDEPFSGDGFVGDGSGGDSAGVSTAGNGALIGVPLPTLSVSAAATPDENDRGGRTRHR